MLPMVMIMVVFFFPELSFAQEESTMKDTFEIVNIFLWFFSWFWIVPAALAWELITNEYVFWAKLNLEIHLRRIWVIMRTFANFFLGGLFLFYLVKQIIDSVKWAAVSDFIRKLLKLLLAAILVNMSFFIMRAVVDLSLIATAAVTSLPHAVIESRWDGLKNQIQVKSEYCIDSSKLSSSSCDQQQNKVLGVDSILPKSWNMAGPLLFIGVWMLDLLATDFVPIKAQNRENIALVTITKLILILLFTAPVLALLIVNLMRIFYIWMWTIFSPFIIIDLVMKSWTDDSPLGKLRDRLKYQDLGQLLALIFVPVVVVAAMSLWLIMLMGFMSVIKWWENYANRTVGTIQVTGNANTWANLRIPAVMDLGIKWSLFKETQFRTLWVFGEAMMMFFAMAILRAMVKLSFSFSSIADKLSDRVFSTIGGFAKTIPIPIAWWISVWAMQKAWPQIAKNAIWLEALQKNSKQTAKERADRIQEFFTGKKRDYSYDIDPSLAASINPVDWVAANITSLQDAISWKSQVRYSWNIKEVFDGMQKEELLRDYFSGYENMEEVKGTVWRDNFVRDVLEGTLKGTNDPSYQLKDTSTLTASSSFTPKAST